MGTNIIEKSGGKKKKIIAGIIIGSILIGCGFWVYKVNSTKSSTEKVILGTVKKGDINEVIAATGTVEFQNVISLGFEQTNNGSVQINGLYVKQGDVVKKGQVLAKIDDTTLIQSIKQKQLNLAAAQAKLQETIDTSNSSSLASLSQAWSTLNNAQSALVTAQQNNDPAYLANQVYLAQQSVDLASDALTKAQQSGNSSSIASAQSSLKQAQTSLTIVENAENGGANQALAAAQAEYKTAQSKLEYAKTEAEKSSVGVSAELLSAQASLAQAQAELSTAEDNLTNASITAPIDGVIVTVSAEDFQTLSGLTTIITMVKSSDAFEINTTVDQADISKIRCGQKADITLDTLADTHISGTVAQFDLQGTIASGVTTFNVKVAVDSPNSILRAGMNSNVNIILAQAKDVLIVPSEAVINLNNQNFVRIPKESVSFSTNSEVTSSDTNTKENTSLNKDKKSGLMNTNFVRVPVVIGMNDGTNIEIMSGLTEGQSIITAIQTISATTTDTSSNSSSGSSSANMNSNHVPGLGGLTGGSSGGRPKD